MPLHALSTLKAAPETPRLADNLPAMIFQTGFTPTQLTKLRISKELQRKGQIREFYFETDFKSDLGTVWWPTITFLLWSITTLTTEVLFCQKIRNIFAKRLEILIKPS